VLIVYASRSRQAVATTAPMTAPVANSSTTTNARAANNSPVANSSTVDSAASSSAVVSRVAMAACTSAVCTSLDPAHASAVMAAYTSVRAVVDTSAVDTSLVVMVACTSARAAAVAVDTAVVAPSSPCDPAMASGASA
jgi:hypothetical protein